MEEVVHKLTMSGCQTGWQLHHPGVRVGGGPEAASGGIGDRSCHFKLPNDDGLELFKKSPRSARVNLIAIALCGKSVDFTNVSSIFEEMI